jgi:hypothetical protein
MINKIKQWLNKGEGGQFYEPYVTNRDIVQIIILTIITSTLIIMGLNFMTLKG